MSDLDPYEELAAQVKWLRRHAASLWAGLISLAAWCASRI